MSISRRIAICGAILLSGSLAAGCAGKGGAPEPVVAKEVPETGDDWMEAWAALLEWGETGDFDVLRHSLDPIGPDPAGPDSLTLDWREPVGPTVEGPPLNWWDMQFEDLEIHLGEDWDLWENNTNNLVITGSVMGTTSNPPGGLWRLGVHANSSLEDGTWLSVGLSGGQGFEGPAGSSEGEVTDFGIDLHLRSNIAVRPDRTRTHWLLGIRGGFYRWGSRSQVHYGNGYGGLALDYPLGERTYLTVQATLGLRWIYDGSATSPGSYPFESLALEMGLDVGVVIPLGGPDKSD